VVGEGRGPGPEDRVVGPQEEALRPGWDVEGVEIGGAEGSGPPGGVGDHRLAHQDVHGELIDGGAARDEVGGWIDVRTGVGPEVQQGDVGRVAGGDVGHPFDDHRRVPGPDQEVGPDRQRDVDDVAGQGPPWEFGERLGPTAT
jgi:hypothetical protein